MSHGSYAERRWSVKEQSANALVLETERGTSFHLLAMPAEDSMFTWISSTYHLIFALSGRIWRLTKKFLGNGGSPLPSTKQALLVMKAELIPLGPLAANGSLVIDKLPAALGRKEHADVRLDDPCVSRVHCEVSDLNGTLVVRDLGSKHGTYVNGQKVTQAPLLPGDRLTVGMSSFEVQYERGRTKPSIAGEHETAN